MAWDGDALDNGAANLALRSLVEKGEIKADALLLISLHRGTHAGKLRLEGYVVRQLQMGNEAGSLHAIHVIQDGIPRPVGIRLSPCSRQKSKYAHRNRLRFLVAITMP